MKPPIRLVLLWHLHQPEYTDPLTQAPTMPWTRLHALKDYADMVEHLARHPGVRATVNVVPSLLDQLAALRTGRGKPDPFLEVARKSAAALSGEEKRFLVTHFFSFNRDTLARDLRRVHELAALRGDYGSDPIPQSAVDRFDEEALRDLQVLFHLAWSGPLLRRERLTRELVEKGRRFSEEDKQALLELQQVFVDDVLPRFRRLADQGRIEFSVSAYYHPILPLLCGLDAALEALPSLRIPERAFSHAEDARLQLDAAFARFEGLFGRKPAGGWPPEGAISEASLALMGQAGYRWTASDEDVLLGSLGERLPADRGTADFRRETLLYRPWRFRDGPVLLFRDHELSDRIGFVYSAWHPRLAAEDFLRRLTHLREVLPENQGPYTVSVILDGENAWEYYHDNGEEFFEALYGGLESEPAIETLTASQAADPSLARDLPRVVAGSWIGRNLATWIGHPEKNRAWERLTETREFVARARGAPSAEDSAWRAVLAAEGSDWFWWFGDDHFTPFAAEFDAAFRRQLRAAWSAAGADAPEILTRAIRDRAPRGFHLPFGPLAPVVDGCVTDYFEWLPAGKADTGSGTMQSATRLVREVYYGSDGTRLYLRLDPCDPPAEASLGGAILSLRLPGHPEKTRRVPLPASGAARAGDVEMAVGRVVEAAFPLEPFQDPDGNLHFQVEIETLDGVSQRIPRDGSLYLPAPEEDPSRFDWSV